MILASSGSGKTCFATLLASQLAKIAPVAIFDPKKELFEGVLSTCPDPEKLVIFDSGAQATPSFDPTQYCGLDFQTHSEEIALAFRAAFDEKNLEVQTQIRRFSQKAIQLILENGLQLDVLPKILTPKSDLRDHLVKDSSRQMKEFWDEYIKQVTPYRREILMTPTLTRFDMFCTNSTIKGIIAGDQPINFPDCFREKKTMLFHFQSKITWESAQMLNSLCLRTLVNQAWATYEERQEKNLPLYLIIDEAERMFEKDPSFLSKILEYGRSMLVHCILIFHNFGQVGDPNMLSKVLSGCALKIIGRGVIEKDLKQVCDEIFSTDWHPHMERYSEKVPWFDQKLAKQTIVSEQAGGGRGRGSGYGGGEGLSAPTDVPEDFKGAKETESETGHYNESETESQTWGTAVTRQNFYRQIKKVRKTGVQFLSYDDFIRTMMRVVKLQDIGDFLAYHLKVGAHFFHAVLLEPKRDWRGVFDRICSSYECQGGDSSFNPGLRADDREDDASVSSGQESPEPTERRPEESERFAAVIKSALGQREAEETMVEPE